MKKNTKMKSFLSIAAVEMETVLQEQEMLFRQGSHQRQIQVHLKILWYLQVRDRVCSIHC